MKKYLLYGLIILMLTSCAVKDNKIENTVVDEPVEVVEEPKYQDDNPIKVGLYLDGKLMDEYHTKIVDGTDIVVFEVYYTNESNVGNNSVKYNFNKYYANYDNIDKYKIGFQMSFDTRDEHMETTILDPSKMHELYYIYNYLYDDIHQADGAWYSHVEMEDVKDNTLYTSIKLYAGGYTYKITSPITLTVFTYDDMDDFDENGKYRGNSYHTVTIYND